MHPSVATTTVVHAAATHSSVTDTLWDIGPVPEPWEVVLESLVAMVTRMSPPIRRRIQLALKHMPRDAYLVPVLKAVRVVSSATCCCGGRAGLGESRAVTSFWWQVVSDEVYCGPTPLVMRDLALEALEEYRSRRESAWGRGFVGGGAGPETITLLRSLLFIVSRDGSEVARMRQPQQSASSSVVGCQSPRVQVVVVGPS